MPLSPRKYASAAGINSLFSSEVSSFISVSVRGFFDDTASRSSKSICSQGLFIFSASALPASSPRIFPISLPIILRRSTKPIPFPLSLVSIACFISAVARFISSASPLSLAFTSPSLAFCTCSSLNISAVCANQANGFVFEGSSPLGAVSFSPTGVVGLERPSEASLLPLPFGSERPKKA